jgi:ubiquinol oxidase
VFFLAYLLSPRLCHRFVGYIEEEAVRTYTKAIEAYDAGKLPELVTMEVPPIARSYWRLAPDATMRDALLAVRADEANHRDVNHTFSTLHTDQVNPYVLKAYRKSD